MVLKHELYDEVRKSYLERLILNMEKNGECEVDRKESWQIGRRKIIGSDQGEEKKLLGALAKNKLPYN